MSDPFGGLFGNLDEFQDIFDAYRRNSEPTLHEAQDRVRRELLEIRPSWITVAGVAKRAGLSERAAATALDTLKNRGVVKRGRRKEGGIVWRWAS